MKQPLKKKTRKINESHQKLTVYAFRRQQWFDLLTLVGIDALDRLLRGVCILTTKAEG